MNMSVYSYMANNKKKWRAVYRYTDFTGKRRQTQEKRLQHKKRSGVWLEIRRKPKTDKLNMTFGKFL